MVEIDLKWIHGCGSGLLNDFIHNDCPHRGYQLSLDSSPWAETLEASAVSILPFSSQNSLSSSHGMRIHSFSMAQSILLPWRGYHRHLIQWLEWHQPSWPTPTGMWSNNTMPVPMILVYLRHLHLHLYLYLRLRQCQCLLVLQILLGYHPFLSNEFVSTVSISHRNWIDIKSNPTPPGEIIASAEHHPCQKLHTFPMQRKIHTRNVHPAWRDIWRFTSG